MRPRPLHLCKAHIVFWCRGPICNPLRNTNQLVEAYHVQNVVVLSQWPIAFHHCPMFLTCCTWHLVMYRNGGLVYLCEWKILGNFTCKILTLQGRVRIHCFSYWQQKMLITYFVFPPAFWILVIHFLATKHSVKEVKCITARAAFSTKFSSAHLWSFL